ARRSRRIWRQHRAAPLNPQSAGDCGLIGGVLPNQPFPQAALPRQSLGGQRTAKLLPRNPALLQHEQADWNTMLMLFINAAVFIDFAFQIQMDPLRRALVRAGPTSFENGR